MIKDYLAIAAYCKANSNLSAKLIDEWLIYYAAQKDRLEEKFKQGLKPYSQVAREIKKSDVNMLISQYIAHSIFKSGGLIKKYLNHSSIKQRGPNEYRFPS